MDQNKIKEKFDRNITNHQMAIRFDAGIYRHLVFRNPESSAMWFEIVTWPGSLVYTGDMGTFVFERIPDMFEFFRNAEINPHYWSEKVEAGVTR